MDENRYLVLLKGRDKTSQVQRFHIRGQVAVVVFEDSPKEYTYTLRDVEILESRTVINVADNQVVYQGDLPIPGIRRIVNFGSKVRAVSERQTARIYDSKDIRIETSGICTPAAEQVVEYWVEIAKYASVSDQSTDTDTDTFLKRQFDPLIRFVSPKSVLTMYLTQAPIDGQQRLGLDTVFPFRFNLSQREALNNALHNRISVIEGPPGTGKTQTILNILANLVLHNKTVAVVSSNNAAVQNVQDKLDAQGYGFLVAALGNAANRKRFFESPPQADVSGWERVGDEEKKDLRKQLAELNRQIDRLMRLERERAALQYQLSEYRLEQAHFETFYTAQDVDTSKQPSFFRPTPSRLLAFLADMRSIGSTNGFLRKLSLFFRYGLVASKRVNSTDVLLYVQQKYYKSKIEQLTRKIAAVDAQLNRESFPDILSRHQKISKQLFQQELYTRYNNTPGLEFGATNYKRQFDRFVPRYPIVLSTTHSLRNCIPRDFLFDYVIIDESSQVDLVTAALALSCGQNAIIVGDTKQLPQIVDERIRTKVPLSDKMMGSVYDYFKHNILSSVLSLYGDTVPRVMLREHYRCHPRIINFCNQKYYDGQLIPFTTEQEGDNPLVIYRTVEGNHMNRLTHGRKGSFNQRELDVIESEVLAGIQTGAAGYTDIGFTTPYRKQVEKASSQLAAAIEKDTIHKYQGREKRVMILSTVLDSSPAGRRGLEFVNDPCLINVAVSRAQERLILVTDHSMFRNNASEIGDLLRYMEYNTLDENIIDSEIVSVFDLLYRDYSQKLVHLNRRVKKRSQYQTENIVWTLLNDVFQDTRYTGLACREQVFMRNLFRDLNRLTSDQRRYVKNGSSVDFVIYHKLDRTPVLAIEVDGFTYHENNPRQLERDKMKDAIFATYGLPLLRLPTTGSEERKRICEELDDLLEAGEA